MKAAFYTLGCKVNQYDSEMMSHRLQEAGYEITDFSDHADVFIINTCTVTHVSDKKSRQMISRTKRANPSAIIVVCGCFSQISPAQAATLEGVDIVLGTANRKDILFYIEQFRQTKQQIVAPADLNLSDITDEKIASFSDKTRAIVKIEDGCRNFCSYCIIPYARGPIRSKPLEEIQKEVFLLTDAGYTEVVLTGIHLGSYGKDLNNVSLADAICAVQENPKIERIRLGSLEPRSITEDFLQKIAHCDKVMPAFHLSLQSGSDSVLHRMNRKYTTEEYVQSVALLRSSFPGCAITTDIIVGFPGESEEEFSQTLAFAEKIAFAKIHIFPYSKREGTPAAKMPRQIDESIKKEREKRLSAVEIQTRGTYMKEQIGKERLVLLERKLSDGRWSGYTENYLPSLVESNETLCSGSCIKVIVTDIQQDTLICRVL